MQTILGKYRLLRDSGLNHNITVLRALRITQFKYLLKASHYPGILMIALLRRFTTKYMISVRCVGYKYWQHNYHTNQDK
ncbi:hypothetical protein Lbir_2491 [Legionella birminghamensis]|uniref:Uncharacterized protein n=1 Tax=Legionella birminghamensis TaxID=28083 RepID=A0A378I988_9GAMM|nr:hypothetical protein Lbir_2491 [Legionella birminghamensis]STX31402.1 Uncharacterised protein [Legionella birminghamensis]